MIHTIQDKEFGAMRVNDFEIFDADGAIFFSRQLESLKSQTYDVKYADLTFRTLFPVTNEAGPGTRSITYTTYDQAGMAEIISSYAKDLPRADIRGKQTTIQVRDLGISVGWTTSDIRAAIKGSVPLQTRKFNAQRRGMEQKMNDLAFFGDVESGLLGLFNNPNLPIANVINGAGGFPEWSTKTPDEILFDMCSIVNDIHTDTLQVETANTLLLPPVQFALIGCTARSSNSDLTILEYFKRNNPGIAILAINQMTGTGTAGADVMIAYDRSPNTLQFEIPMEMNFLPEERRGLEVLINAEASIGGLNVYYPLALSIREGI